MSPDASSSHVRLYDENCFDQGISVVHQWSTKETIPKARLGLYLHDYGLETGTVLEPHAATLTQERIELRLRCIHHNKTSALRHYAAFQPSETERHRMAESDEGSAWPELPELSQLTLEELVEEVLNTNPPPTAEFDVASSHAESATASAGGRSPDLHMGETTDAAPKRKYSHMISHVSCSHSVTICWKRDELHCTVGFRNEHSHGPRTYGA